jgi:Tol biopolymer transport system component
MVSKRLAFAIVVALVAGRVASAQQTELVSVDSSGTQANQYSYCWGSAISADGRLVAFVSAASNLVSNDTNGWEDVFVRDRQAGTTSRVSVDSSGAEGDYGAGECVISADGRVVAFHSSATNLVAGDTNGCLDVFVHDLVTGVTERVSVDSSGVQADRNSFHPALSGDGQFVAFASYATNLVPGTNFRLDVYVHDRSSGITERVSVDSSGNQGDGNCYVPSLSADGRFVAFEGWASNLVAGDTNKVGDIFVHDRSTGITERVSVHSSGAQAWAACNSPTISGDGSVVAFLSGANSLVASDTNHRYDVFVHDRTTGATERVSVDSAGGEGNGDSGSFDDPSCPAISQDGSTVAFSSVATNLVAGDTNDHEDVFVHDRRQGVTMRVSIDGSGAEADGDSVLGGMTPDGGSVAFSSGATNLVAGDVNATGDVFVHDGVRAIWSNYGAGLAGTQGVPALTSNGDPSFGATITVTAGNSYAQPTSGLLFLGFQRAQIPTHFGADLLVAPTLALPITFSYGADAFSGAIPNDPTLAGFAIDLQVVEADPGAVKGVSFTPGLELLVGY